MTFSILRKEWHQLFSSMSGYVFLALFQAVSGFLFVMANITGRNGDIKNYFASMFTITLFLIPLLTMRLFSEEKKSGTFTLLLTSPFNVTGLVLEKYCTVLLVVFLSLAITFAYPLILAYYGSFALTDTVCNYLGFFLMLAAFLAVGLFVSVITENQFIAAVLTYAVILLFYALDNTPLRFLSLRAHYESLTYGVLDMADIIFFLSIIALFLYLAVFALDVPRVAHAEKKIYRIVTVLAVVNFLLLNLFFQALSARHPLRVDTTDEKLYALSADTESLLTNLTEETNLYVLSAEDEYPVLFKELLSRYDAQSDMLSVTYIDPYENPSFVSSFSSDTLHADAGDIIAEGMEGVTAVAYEDLFTSEDGVMTSLTAEGALSGAIAYVNSAECSSVLFVSGHNERPTEALLSIFTDNRFEVHTSMLGAATLTDTDIVVLAAPAADLSAAEGELLSSYLQGGGTLLVFLEPSDAEYPVLFDILSAYGMAYRDDVIRERTLFTDGNPLNITPYFTTHDINLIFETERFVAVMPNSRSLELNTAGGATAQPLLITSASAYATPSDEDAPFVLAAISETDMRGSVFAAGSRLMYADDILSSASFANRTFLVRVVNALSDTATVLDIPAKNTAAPAINVTNAGERIIFFVFVLLLPLLFLLLGGITFLRRKRL